MTTRPASERPMPSGMTSAGSDSLSGQSTGDSQCVPAAEGQDSRPANESPVPIAAAPTGLDSLGSPPAPATQAISAAEGQDSPQATRTAAPMGQAPAGTNTSHGQATNETQLMTAVAPSSPQAGSYPSPIPFAPAGSNTSHGQTGSDDHSGCAVAANFPGQNSADSQHSRAGDLVGQPAATLVSMPKPRMLLADPFLALAADVLDDLETVRVANENRLRQLTRTATDTDGEERGFGLDAAHPDVARLAALVDMLVQAEHQATLNLGRLMRRHPLGAWVAGQKGIGEKQGARLLAAIGDPYWNTLHDRPRTVSELWAYCGYHVVPASQVPSDAQVLLAGGNGSHPGQGLTYAQDSSAGVAPRRQRGQQSNWNDTARKRAWLIAAQTIRYTDSPYRPIYDNTRTKYADAVHAQPCHRCGPKGHPAVAGSDLSDGHKHARALRAIAKTVLKDIWNEAKRVHNEGT